MFINLAKDEMYDLDRCYQAKLYYFNETVPSITGIKFEVDLTSYNSMTVYVNIPKSDTLRNPSAIEYLNTVREVITGKKIVVTKPNDKGLYHKLPYNGAYHCYAVNIWDGSTGCQNYFFVEKSDNWVNSLVDLNNLGDEREAKYQEMDKNSNLFLTTLNGIERESLKRVSCYIAREYEDTKSNTRQRKIDGK